MKRKIEESWQDFKEEANPPFERALSEVTHAGQRPGAPRAVLLAAGLALLTFLLLRRRSD